MATGIPIFEGAISQWNEHQVEFLSWCHFYYQINQTYDDLPPDIIDNDELLDNFLYRKKQEIKKAKMQQKIDSMKHSRKGANKRQIESFNVYDPNDVY